MRITNLDSGAVIHSLRTSAEGLTPVEAKRRLAEYGPNQLEEVGRTPLPKQFAREFSHLFALILWFAAALAFVADHYDPSQGMARLGVAIVGVILINGTFSFWQEYKAERAVAALRSLLPQRVKAVRGAKTIRILASQLVPGDVVLLEEGDCVPADCRLIEAARVRVNAATLTGESRPRSKVADPVSEASPLQAANVLLAGTLLVSGQARAVVFATGMHTAFGRIAHLTQTAGEAISPLKREVMRLTRVIALIATGLGLSFFAIGQAIGLPFWENMLFAIGIIVANVPEGLLPTLTLSLAMATQRMAKRHALVRHLPAVEALGSTTVIVSDKTGTLTQNRMTVRRVWLHGTLQMSDAVEAGQAFELLRCAQLCHNLKSVDGGLLGDPMEVALAEYAGPRLDHPPGGSREGENPFDAERKRMSVIYTNETGRILYCKGALESLLPLCEQIRLKEGDATLTEEWRDALIAAQDTMAKAGLRVLAFGYRPLDEQDDGTERDLVLTGLMGLEDPPRPEVAGAVARCTSAGIRVIVCSGDHPQTAVAIAREIGLVRDTEPLVIVGEALRRMNRAQLQLALDAPEIVFARMQPEHKLRIVETLKRKGEIVAVTGDGVNDAPALKTAHIGIAMGLTGTDVAKEAADLILLDDNFASIVAAIEEGRAVFDNIRKFMTYILTSNIPEIVPYLAFVLFKIPLPLTIIQILAVDLGTDMLPALALGAERPAPGIMQRPPRARQERLLDWSLLARAYLFLGLLEAMAAMAVFFFVLHAGGWRHGEALASQAPLYLQATTGCLAAIVLMQMANLFLCRDPERSMFARSQVGNRLILIGLVVELAFILGIVYTPVGHWLFGTTAIGAEVWLAAVPFALGMILLEEGRKAWQRHAPFKRG